IAVNGSSSHASCGYQARATMVNATACRVWPDGKLNSSSGAIQARMRTSAAKGRGRRVQRLRPLYSSRAMAPVAAMWAEARRPSAPSNSPIAATSTYQTRPSPRRLVAANRRSTPAWAHQSLVRKQTTRSARWRSGKGRMDIGMAPAVGDALEDGVEIRRHVGRAQRLHRVARVGAHGAARSVLEREAAGGIDERGFVVQRDGGPMHAVLQVLAGSAVAIGDGGHAAGHGLDGDVAEGFGQAREQEQIGAGEVA